MSTTAAMVILAFLFGGPTLRGMERYMQSLPESPPQRATLCDNLHAAIACVMAISVLLLMLVLCPWAVITLVWEAVLWLFWP